MGKLLTKLLQVLIMGEEEMPEEPPPKITFSVVFFPGFDMKLAMAVSILFETS